MAIWIEDSESYFNLNSSNEDIFCLIWSQILGTVDAQVLLIDTDQTLLFSLCFNPNPGYLYRIFSPFLKQNIWKCFSGAWNLLESEY